jgi:diguanylate cyclase (GGDEF)-like protein
VKEPDRKNAASWSLRHTLTRMLLLTALLPVFVFGVALLWTQWQRDRDELLLRLATSAQSSANAFDDFLDGDLAGVRLLADTPALAPGLQDAGLELQRLLKAYPGLLRAIATDADGRILAVRATNGRAVARAEENAADRDWFRIPRDSGNPYVSDAYRARIYGREALVAVSAPLLRDGNFQGVVQASLPIDRLVGQRSDSLRRRGFELLVLDRANRVVHASAGLRWHFLDQAGAIGADIRREAGAPGQAGQAHVANLLADGGHAYVNAMRMRTGWVVAVVAPRQRLLAPSLPRLGLMLGLLAVTTLGVLLALWRMRRLLVTNMGRLLGSLHGYALGGTLDPRLLSRMPEELQPLASGIGELAARMNAAFGELRVVLDQREHAIADRTRELSDAVTELDRLSRTDALTGSLNYRGFQEQALRVWEAASDRCEALAVLAIDIDHFKAYNDRYGHLQGDNALRRFAGTVRSALLHADDVLARQGGEEFAVLLPGATEVQASAVAARIRERLREADIAHAGSPSGRMTASIGIATMPAGAPVALGTLLTQADAALYRAKTAGRDRAEV